MLERKSFSTLTQEEIKSMWDSNNLVASGYIKFGSGAELLGDNEISCSFLQQLDKMYQVNVDSVIPFNSNLTFQTEAGC